MFRKRGDIMINFIIVLFATLQVNASYYYSSTGASRFEGTDIFDLIARSIDQTSCELEGYNCHEFCYSGAEWADFSKEYKYCPKYLKEMQDHLNFMIKPKGK